MGFVRPGAGSQEPWRRCLVCWFVGVEFIGWFVSSKEKKEAATSDVTPVFGHPELWTITASIPWCSKECTAFSRALRRPREVEGRVGTVWRYNFVLH